MPPCREPVKYDSAEPSVRSARNLPGTNSGGKIGQRGAESCRHTDEIGTPTSKRTVLGRIHAAHRRIWRAMPTWTQERLSWTTVSAGRVRSGAWSSSSRWVPDHGRGRVLFDYVYAVGIATADFRAI
jgi:hypothetical protein